MHVSTFFYIIRMYLFDFITSSSSLLSDRTHSHLGTSIYLLCISSCLYVVEALTTMLEPWLLCKLYSYSFRHQNSHRPKPSVVLSQLRLFIIFRLLLPVYVWVFVVTSLCLVAIVQKNLSIGPGRFTYVISFNLISFCAKI